ncbi:hypothetical protein [Ignatzschineria rhizosphaerae]|uniref:hypothetical protein n=1 Tax=Ignatzschineria rhizosphaerae TaxID=2923279 RepID=UPI0022CF1AAB|nr:hypothetical protein [Ignatzschineria rhizosphaerae]
MIYGILLIILGLLASPLLVLSKKPNAKELLDKVAPYQGFIGVIFLIWGVWGIIASVLSINFLAHAPIWWITGLAVAILEALLGFIMGYGLVTKYVLNKNEAAKAKGEAVLAKIAPL